MGKKKFRVRWTVKPKREGWVQAIANEEVVLTNQLQTEEWGPGTPLVKTTISRETGFIAPVYLKGFDTVNDDDAGGTNTNTTDTDGTDGYGGSRERGKKKKAGTTKVTVGPLEAAEHLRSAQLASGTFVVCCPPEYHQYRTHPEYLIVVRLYTGSEEEMLKDWERERKRRQATLEQAITATLTGDSTEDETAIDTTPSPRHGGSKAGGLLTKCDTLPGFRAPIPFVGFIRIQREQETGRYLLFREEGTYGTIHELLAVYKDKLILLDFNVTACLKSSPPANAASEGAKPPCFQEPARRQKEQKGSVASRVPPGTVIQSQNSLPKSGFYGNSKAGYLNFKDEKHEQTRLKVAMKIIMANPNEYYELFNELCKMQSDGIWGNYIHHWRFIVDGIALERKHKSGESAKQVYRTGLCAEFCEHGTLNNYLRVRAEKNQMLKLRPLLEILYQMASALAYLEYVKVLHLAIGARNVVVRKVSFNSVHVSVSDFHLPALRLVTKDQQFVRKKKIERLPWRWMAVESIRSGTFTAETDIWAFGIAMFEVLTHCQEEPYASEKRITCSVALLGFLEMGHRLSLNDQVIPAYLQSVMRDCWDEEPLLRPKMSILMSLFREMLFDSVVGAGRAVFQYESQAHKKVRELKEEQHRAQRTAKRRPTNTSPVSSVAADKQSPSGRHNRRHAATLASSRPVDKKKKIVQRSKSLESATTKQPKRAKSQSQYDSRANPLNDPLPTFGPSRSSRITLVTVTRDASSSIFLQA